MPVETVTVNADGAAPNRVQTDARLSQRFSFAPDDTDDHDGVFDGRGKGDATVQLENDGDVQLDAEVYGAPDPSKSVGDAGVVQLATFNASPNDGAHQAITDPFPYYIVRVSYASGPSGTETFVYMHFARA